MSYAVEGVVNTGNRLTQNVELTFNGSQFLYRTNGVAIGCVYSVCCDELFGKFQFGVV